MTIFHAKTAAMLVLALPLAMVNAQTCSFTKEFGTGMGLQTNGVETFESAPGATTTCSLSCNGAGINAGMFLMVRYGDAPDLIFNDANGEDFDGGCDIALTFSSGFYQTSLGWDITAGTFDTLTLTCSCSEAGVYTASTCFSADTTVQVQGKSEPVLMKDLQMGDKVKSGPGHYQTVYSFGHRDETKETEFVQLYFQNDEREHEQQPLELSPKHMVFVDETSYLWHFWPQTKAVRADEIQPGHVLLLDQNQKATVTRIDSIVKPGAYMPLTLDGTILVNNVQASSYVSIADEGAASVVENLDFYGFSEQNLVHWWLAPFRMLCMGVSSKFCSTNPGMMSTSQEDDSYGILKWLLAGRTYARYANDWGFLVHHIVGIPTAVVFGFLVAMEYIVGPSLAPTMLVAMATFVFWRMCSSERRQYHNVKGTEW